MSIAIEAAYATSSAYCARVCKQNLAVYGADKVWDQLNKDGIRVARCTIERLMANMGLQGCRRGRLWVRTTEGDDRLDRPADLVERQFRAPAPNRSWVADPTYVKPHSGWVHVAFIVEVFSPMVVGWQASRSLLSDRAIGALEMAVFNRQSAGADLSHLVHHSDRGVQYFSVRYCGGWPTTPSLRRSGPRATAMTVSMTAESFNGLSKWELIYPKGPWRDFDDVEFATFTYVDWFNNRRLHGEIEPGPGFTTPTAFEAGHYRQTISAEQA